MDPDFLSEINKSDIIGISETHIFDEILSELDIPGFKRISYKNRKKLKNANKTSGGIAVFAKNNIAKYLEPFKTHNEDIIWIKLKKKYHKLSNDLFIGTVYVSGENNTKSIGEKIKKLSADIETIKATRGDIIIQGDFNARTANTKDFVEYDKHDKLSEIDCVEFFDIPPRCSEDKIQNVNGKELLELCKAYNLCIMNGRKTGDHIGNFTSFQPGGNSVIDYAVVSQSLFQNVLTFNVGEFYPWISDHCAIHLNIDIKENLDDETLDASSTTPVPTTWHWDDESAEKLENFLKGNEAKDLIDQISRSSDGEKMACDISSLLTYAADSCELKRRKQGPKMKHGNSPWFDKECIDLKNSIREIGNKVQRDPYNVESREKLYFLKREYKLKVKKKKIKYKDDILADLESSGKNSKYFWKVIKKLDAKHNENLFKKAISGNDWKKHFESLGTPATHSEIPSSPDENGLLDYEITTEELDSASYVLRPYKSSGLDGVSNEMILCLLKVSPKLILKLFNTILESGKPITWWCTSIIVPIHKKGSKTDPDNYRGIALATCLSKLFAAVLNLRLLNFVLEKGVISKNQLGFMPGNRCSDALIILHNLFNKYCLRDKKYIYACFVDFKKAFDTVPRHILFQKLLSHDVTGKFYNTIKNMYTQDFACVNTGEGLTGKFRISQGVKQGCILSPLLFNIFISDLTAALEEGESDPVKIDENTTLNSLIWADDLLLLSESEKGLNNMLKNLEGYTRLNLIRVNLEKTNCMIFNKSGKLIRRTFMFGKQKVDMTREYKYLGFLMTPSFSIQKGLADLRDRGLKAYYALKSKLGKLFRANIRITLHLFNTCIKPILLYASDFWGCLKLPKQNPIETMYLKFCKDVLGVHIKTINTGVLLELGQIPLCIYGKKNCVKNWDRICRDGNANELLLKSTADDLENDWKFSVVKYISSLDLDFRDIPDPEEQAPSVQVFNREQDTFHEALSDDLKNSSKLKTLSILKTDFACESYLLSVTNVANRTALTKFRLSNHNLMIEKGRYEKLLLGDRSCPFCPDQIEDEFHFLIKCPIYHELRNKMLDDIKDIIFDFYYPPDENFLFWFLLKNPLIADTTGNYLRLSMELRAFLLENPRNHL